jgi:primosomal protein N' (replication factor Y)
MAVVRARLENCPIVLSSATPSLETFVNARNGKYEWLKLAHRYGAADMPAVNLVDLRKETGEPGHFLSPSLRAALADTLAAREQALLFLNRRGYAPLTLCKLCGHKETCRNCSAWMVEHRYRKRLVCHHCAFEIPIPERCPQCNAEGSLVACGPGVERIEEEFRAAFPDARIAIASSDTFSGPAQAQAVIRALAQGDIDVVIGTQIVAKGHHFPQLTLAGIVDADLGGSAGDPRAAERSFQLLHQVAGRSGRGEKPGQVLIQTRNPDDPVMQALAKGSRDEFLDQEARTRERNLTPPFGRLAAIILAGTDAQRVHETGRALALAAPKVRRLSVWGPAPAFYQVLRGRTRERLLVQAEKTIDIQAYLRAWLASVKVPNSVRVTVDVDPVSFF